jgi:recombination protein RecT
MAARDRVRAAATGEPAATPEAPKPAQKHPVLAMLEKPANQNEIAKALPPAYTMERFMRVARTAVQTNSQLLDCHPVSVVAALHKAAAFGLDVGPTGQAYLVPFKGQAQLIIGYRGMLTLARRSGELADVQARAVFENDEFDYAYGLDEKLHHKPRLADKGPLVALWGLARFTNGGHYFVVVDLDEIEEHRMISKTGAKNEGPWRDHFVAMARKTVIRIMEPYLPLTTEAAEAVQNDELPVDQKPFEFLDTTAVPYEPEPDDEGPPDDLQPPDVIEAEEVRP